MKITPVIALLLSTFTFNEVFADDDPSNEPPLELLYSISGVETSSEEYKVFFTKYEFSSNTKAEVSRSFLSPTGVHITIYDGRAHIGIIPASGTRPQHCRYRGDLPKGLKAGDTIDKIEEKLGKPLSTHGEPDNGYWMDFSEVRVYTYQGVLAKIQLIPKKKEAEQDGAGQPATRPESKSEGGDKPQPESEGRSR